MNIAMHGVTSVSLGKIKSFESDGLTCYSRALIVTYRGDKSETEQRFSMFAENEADLEVKTDEFW